MKHLATLLLIITHIISYSQDYSISYRHVEIINYSVKISYSGGTYTPPSTYQGVLNSMQARYDYYHSMVNKAWGQVRYCELLNKSNIKKMRNHDHEVESHLNQYGALDWAANGNFAIQTRDWITSIFNDKHIKAELKTLQSINNEFYRLKRTYPDDFYKRERYYDLAKVLNLIENCDSSEIGEIALKYGLL